MSPYRQSLGRWGESQAAGFLRHQGYTILEQNARTGYGEIDLVTSCAGVLVFVEVKTRSSRAFGLPEQAITPSKRAHLLAAIQSYLQAHPEMDGDWRVDVIAIERGGRGQPPSIVHFEDAVRD